MIVLLCSILFLSTWTFGTDGHMCLWSPMQRGDFDISNPGSHPCYRKIGPCGNINSTDSSPRTVLTAGSQFVVEFQQNLNHYYADKPGSMDVSFANGLNPAESDFRVLHSFNDYNAMNQITQTNFSVIINLPTEPCDQCVLRVRYLSNNPLEDDHGTTFHQCSDIKLIKSNVPLNNPKPIKTQQTAHRGQEDPHDCCAPASFTNAFFHSIPDIGYYADGVIFYDQKARQMRVTVANNGGEGNTTYDGTFDMWMNFTSGYQYYYNRNTGACDLYGLDYWNDWCFGNKYNQSEDFFAANTSCTGQVTSSDRCNQWVNGEFLFESYATDDCLPSGIFRPSGESYEFLKGFIGPIEPSTFEPNPVCLKQKKVKHAPPGWMRRHF